MSLGNTLRTLGPSRLAPIGIVMVGVLAFFMYMASRFSTPNMAVLYNDLDIKDSGQIIQKLESLGVPNQIRADGSQIMVPGDQVARLRMLLAQDGLPRGGSLGYEIFDKSDGLATSSFVQNVNLVRALEGELSRTIGSLGPVRSARVHLVLPQRDVFSRQREEASASIVLQMRSGRLDRSQVAAIQNLVAAAVPGLKINNVSIVDDQGSLLARGGDDSNSSGANNAEELRVGTERRMVQEIESLLEKSVGPGRVRAEVSVEMNFDRITQSSETYDPEKSVIRSSQTVSESGKSREGGQRDGVSVANNLPDSQAGAGAAIASNQNDRTEETTNFEVSKTVTQKVREAGEIKRISVAVLVDGSYTTDAEGKQTYQPRSEENLKQLETLIKGAVGFQEDRGDTVQVVNMQFVNPVDAAPGTVAEAAGGMMGFSSSEIMRLAETLVMGLVGILALLLVVRPLMNRLAAEPAGGGRGAIGGRSGGGNLALPAPGGGGEQLALPEPEVSNAELDEMINMRQIEGRIKASSLKRISEIVEKHPEETLSIIRTWLYQGKEARNAE